MADAYVNAETELAAAPTIKIIAGTSHTLAPGDAVEAGTAYRPTTNAGAVTITLPDAVPAKVVVGYEHVYVWAGDGQPSFAAGSANVVIKSASSGLKIAEKDRAVSVFLEGVDNGVSTYRLIGPTAA